MSTTYYALIEPFTSIRLDEGSRHDRISFWEQRARAGALAVTAGKGREIVMRFMDERRPLLRTHYGGADVGVIVTELQSELKDSTIVISEYGRPTPVAVVRARRGAGKRVTGEKESTMLKLDPIDVNFELTLSMEGGNLVVGASGTPAPDAIIWQIDREIERSVERLTLLRAYRELVIEERDQGRER